MIPSIKQCGKVINYDFAPNHYLTVQMRCDRLYADERVLLMRFTYTLGGKPFGVMHFMADIVTGKITHL